jgi:hypothetical protein
MNKNVTDYFWYGYVCFSLLLIASINGSESSNTTPRSVVMSTQSSSGSLSTGSSACDIEKIGDAKTVQEPDPESYIKIVPGYWLRYKYLAKPVELLLSIRTIKRLPKELGLKIVLAAYSKQIEDEKSKESEEAKREAEAKEEQSAKEKQYYGSKSSGHMLPYYDWGNDNNYYSPYDSVTGRKMDLYILKYIKPYHVDMYDYYSNPV